MIRIKNQITCVFSIGDISDFISPENLISFELYETAGNVRPLFKMEFILNHKKVLNYLNAGNILKINFGINEPSSEVIQFELQGDNTNANYTLGNNVKITGALYIPGFTNLVKDKSYGKKSSFEVIKEIATNSRFNFVTNVSKSNDRQEWYQNGETDWKYLEEVWYHSYINDDTFLAFAFDANNMYFYDVRSLLLNDPKWKFSTEFIGENNSNVINFGQYFTENNYGVLSDLVGKNISNTTFNVTTGEFKSFDYKLKNFTTLDSNKLNINNKDCKDYTYNIISGDVHENYIKAQNQNIRNNIMYSTYAIYLPTAGQFKKLRLLDTATIQTNPRDERVSGVSFITAICYQYKDKKLLTNVTLNKEAPSGLRGEDLLNG